MNVKLSEQNLIIATTFFLGQQQLFDKKDEDYQNMFKAYATDNNSSTLRERVILYYLGYESYDNKLGADGLNPVTKREVEVKPKYIAYGKKGNGSAGNFNDLTYDLLDKKKNQDIICGLFQGNVLIFIVEFPMEVIYDYMKNELTRLISKNANRKTVSFSYKEYDSPKLILHYFNDFYAKECLNKNHYKMLRKFWTPEQREQQEKITERHLNGQFEWNFKQTLFN